MSGISSWSFQHTVGEKVRRGKARDSNGRKSRPETGSLHHPVAEAAISSFDPLNRGALSLSRGAIVVAAVGSGARASFARQGGSEKFAAGIPNYERHPDQPLNAVPLRGL